MADTGGASSVVALIVGVGTVLATVVVAAINKRVGRADARSQLNSDIALAKQLVVDSPERRLLEFSISHQIKRLVILENPSLRAFRKDYFFVWMCAQGFTTFAFILEVMNHQDEWALSKIEGLIVVIALVFIVLVVLGAFAQKTLVIDLETELSERVAGISAPASPSKTDRVLAKLFYYIAMPVPASLLGKTRTAIPAGDVTSSDLQAPAQSPPTTAIGEPPR